MRTDIFGQDVSLARFAGRRMIYSDVAEITKDNIVSELQKAIPVYDHNVSQISYLWRYYRGEQPILARVKEVRPEICNRIVENHAQQIVAFKVGYQLNEPVQYIARESEWEGDHEKMETALSDKVADINTSMFAKNKESLDHDLFTWLCIGGIGYRLTLPKKTEKQNYLEDCYDIYTIDPRGAFVVYSSDFRREPLMGVIVNVNPDTYERTFSVYTTNKFFRVVGDKVVEESGHIIGAIPLVEYQLNSERMGVFEPVLDILDEINNIESNRMDDIEQNVQSLMKFVNCDIDEEKYEQMLARGAVKVVTIDGVQGDVEILSSNLDQSNTQTNKEDKISQMCSIVGMPYTSDKGSSTSDTGTAVMLRDGWTMAETHAKGYELQWKKSERQMLNIVLNICNASPKCAIDLRVSDIDLSFNRRNYDNPLVKAQVLTTMLNENQIDPLLAFQSCGLFTDPQAAYLQSTAHYEQVLQRQQEQFEQTQQRQDKGDGVDDSNGQSEVNKALAEVQK